MCSFKSPKVSTPKVEPVKPLEPVAPLVSASEGDDAEAQRKKGLSSLKVDTNKGSNATGLNIP